MGRIIILAVFSIIGISLFYFYKTPQKQEKPLPIYNPIDLDPEVVDHDLLRLGRGHRVGSFSFTNQLGKQISEKDVEGKVFVVEYFFTTCKTICPIMNKQMQRVQEAYRGNDKVKILSFTVDPEEDDVAQMKLYSEIHHADNAQWWFLTGEKTKLYEAARRYFFVLKPSEVKQSGDAGSDFIHTNNFVLVDQKMRLRGYYEGTKAEEVDRLIKEINLLLQED